MTNTQQTSMMEYAGFWRRLAAVFVDYMVLVAVVVALLFVADPDDLDTLVGLALIPSFVSPVYVIVMWALRGQTLGKMAVGIRIVKADGTAVTFGKAILRFTGYFISSVIVYLGFLSIAWDQKKQGWHDKIAGTFVVKVRQ